MKTKSIILSLVVLAICLFMAVTVYLFQKEIVPRKLAVLGEVQDFQLTDSKAKPLGLIDLKDKIWVADFIFTTCAGPCPVMSQNMASLHRSYRLEDDVAMVSVSVNPDYDTPAVLAKYAKRYEADTNSWHFLTGPIEKIHSLAVESFKIGSVEEPVFHSQYFVLVDGEARIRGYYDGTITKDIQQLFKDMAVLLKEK